MWVRCLIMFNSPTLRPLDNGNVKNKESIDNHLLKIGLNIKNRVYDLRLRPLPPPHHRCWYIFCMLNFKWWLLIIFQLVLNRTLQYWNRSKNNTVLNRNRWAKFESTVYVYFILSKYRNLVDFIIFKSIENKIDFYKQWKQRTFGV